MLVLVVAAVLAAAVPVAMGASPANVLPGQRIDMKVLLMSADGTDSDFGAWKAELAREGVPYDTFVAYNGQTKAATLTDATLADYTNHHAKYDAVIQTNGDLVHAVGSGASISYLSAFTDAEWATLAKFERTFGIRQLSDDTAPSPAHGLNLVGTGGAQDGKVGTLTVTGRAAFPYLKGPIPIPDNDPATAEAFGYEGTPVNPATWETLVAGSSSTATQPTAYLGIYTHPEDGRQEMVMTVASNENQSDGQLLRHGMLSWVTRGVFLGYQRNYLELQIDDVFLPDDSWDTTTHTTDYDPAHAIRMDAADADKAVAWSKANGIRLDLVYNGFGSDQATQPDALLTDLQANKSTFGWINHTYDHPNLDCSSQTFITNEITRNVQWAQQKGFAISPSELVTGEHSGLANTRPGNPGTIDPPNLDAADPAGTGALPAGNYFYGVSATTAHGETTASESSQVTVAAGQGVNLSWNAVCHATSYKVYRATSATGPWALVTTVPESPTAETDTNGTPRVVGFTDTDAATQTGAPPAANGATVDAYPQNANFVGALTAAGVKYVASDASKDYPNPPDSKTVPTSTVYPAGTPFTDGAALAIPRYPTNVYYNTATQAQQLDEFNWLYQPTEGCNATTRTDCFPVNTPDKTFAQYVAGENQVMFRHIMGNDPRPHFFHQTNLAETTTAGGGIFYQVIDPLLATYHSEFADDAPLIQLTPAQIGQTLTQQSTWAAELASGKVTAWLQDGVIHVKNSDTTATDVPLTGTTVGSAYGGQKSGWTSIAAGAEQTFTPADPGNTAAPGVSGSPQVGQTLTAGTGTWSGTPTITYGYQWQRCNAQGAGCTNIAGANGATYVVTAADSGATLRVVVSAGNWISSVSQAASAVVGKTPPVTTGSGGQPGSQPRPGTGPAGGHSGSIRLRLTRVKMSPRRFTVSHRRKLRGTRLDGSRITWQLSKAGTVRLTFQRKAGQRWRTVGTIKRRAAAGAGVVRFTGRFGKHRLSPRRYRLVATAAKGRVRTGPKVVSFRVLSG
jgi:hypothetical protein